MDPDLQMDIITELDLVNTTLGVTQVAGLHNASKAFLFQGKTYILLGMVWGYSHLCCFSCVVLLKCVINRGCSESGTRREVVRFDSEIFTSVLCQGRGRGETCSGVKFQNFESC